jgi:hypothetical protein
MPGIEIVLRIVYDEDELNEYVRSLYDGPPHDPVDGEPEPGLALAKDWVAQAEHHGEVDLWAARTSDCVRSWSVTAERVPE